MALNECLFLLLKKVHEGKTGTPIFFTTRDDEGDLQPDVSFLPPSSINVDHVGALNVNTIVYICLHLGLSVVGVVVRGIVVDVGGLKNRG